MKAHRLASYFPMLEGEEFDKLVKDIKEKGQIHPITIFDGQILDGLNRYRACQSLGIEPITEEYQGNDALGYVISENIRRRQMTVSQRAMLATEMLPEYETEAKKEKLDHGPKVKTEKDWPTTKAASEFDISGKSVRRAKRIKEQAPEKVEAIIQGTENIRSVDTELRQASAKKRTEENIKKGIQKKVKETPKAVKDYFTALTQYTNALEFALEIEKHKMFAHESLNIIKGKHERIRQLMKTLEGGISQ